MPPVGEYDGSGNLVEEAIWLGDIPVATLRPNGSGGINIFYVHTDALNTPRKVSQPTTGTLAWRWDADAFGTVVPNQNPGGLGTFIYNLRFPGQYYQTETGLSQNVNRDYDPLAGGYVQSDPLGVFGGRASTYAYANGNPVTYIDPNGSDVRIENTAAVYGLHQHISVDTPDGPYAISYGMDNRTDPEQGSSAAAGVVPEPSGTVIAQYLRQQVGRRGPYNVLTNSCRTFSRREFNEIRDRLYGAWWQRVLQNLLALGGSPAY